MEGGIVLLNKEPGVSSRSLDNTLMRLFKSKKVGHLGTLDPFASGLLIIAINKGTKFLPYLDDAYKTYIASLKLGVSTSTGDLTGEVIEEKEVKEYSLTELNEVLKSFLGVGLQKPPAYSAIKLNGTPAYKAARKGVILDLKPRAIEIKSINLINYDKTNHLLDFSVTCSKGTYIRSLGEDIARGLDNVGHLVRLCRTAVGDILLAQAKKIEEITEDDLIDPTLLMRGYKHVYLSEEEAKYVLNGRPLKLEGDLSPLVILYYKQEPLAIYEKREDGLYYAKRGLF